MTESSYDVRIWEIRARRSKSRDPKTGKQVITSYGARWAVAGVEFHRSFKNRAHAISFRAELLAAASKGEAFRTDDGLPVSSRRARSDLAWLDLARDYADMKWPMSSPNSRRSTADGLIAITRGMLSTEGESPGSHTLNKVLRGQFSKCARPAELPEDAQGVLQWVVRNTRSAGSLARPEVLREVVTALSVNQDGSPAAPDTARLRRTTLNSVLDYAVEKGLLSENPLRQVRLPKITATLRQVDRRAVPNPIQARTLLHHVGETPDSGPHLVAFFASMYFAALRPEEATNLGKQHLALPENGWGKLHLDLARPEVSGHWTDSGERDEERALKHRRPGEGRTVPCPPELTEILHRHIATFGTAPDGRLFRPSGRSRRVSSSTYGRVWARARAAALTAEAAASPLAATPYDLRHAAVSTWLAAGVPETTVAEWAGHSVAVLLRVYAKVLDRSERAALDRIDELLGPRTQ